jgi:hypothetical protein
MIIFYIILMQTLIRYAVINLCLTYCMIIKKREDILVKCCFFVTAPSTVHSIHWACGGFVHSIKFRSGVLTCGVLSVFPLTSGSGRKLKLKLAPIHMPLIAMGSSLTRNFLFLHVEKLSSLRIVYETWVVLLRCPFVPAMIHGRTNECLLHV